MVVIADPTKDVQAIGAFPLPVEVTPFGYTITAKKVHDALVAAGVERPRVELRKAPRSNEMLVTDGGNYILDCHCGLIPDPPKAAAFLSDVPGVVEHGLFIGIARTVIFGTETGARIIEY
jgi:ribose 5-phosphate isomerase A